MLDRLDNAGRLDIKSLTLEELGEEMEALGERSFRAKQIFEWIHGKGAEDFASMTNISAKLREKLGERFSLTALEIVGERISAIDGTRKYLFRLEDGNLEVFFPNSISKPYMQRRIENAFSFVRMSLKDMPEIRLLRFVAGVAFRSAGTADYDEMSATVSEICTLHSGEANDMVAFADENEKYTWSSQELTGQSQGLQLQQKDTMPGRLMTDADKSVALECL